MVGRKRFDREAVLDSAARQFWRDGYEATSIQDLEAATGLGRGSLYNAFGDKRSLFADVLARYAETEGAAPLRHLAEPDVFVGLNYMLRATAARMSEPGRPPGCLMTNSCFTFDGTGSVAQQVSTGMRAMEAAFESAFVRARDSAQLAADCDVRELARFYCAVIHSLALMHKTLADPATLDDIVTVALRAWPGPAGETE